MDSHRIGLLILLSLLGASITEDVTCPDNEIPGCGSVCAPTCQNKKPNGVCTLQCVGPCVCKPRYIREGPGGMCVPESCEGVPICKKGEEFVQCPNPCPATCDGPRDNSLRCKRMCLRVGCQCQKGYIREAQGGNCIPENECRKSSD